MEEDNKGIGIRDFPINDRPRERLEQLGESALTNAELLAILLRVGIEGSNAIELAQKLLNRFDGLRGLHAAGFEELCEIKGIGRAKAAQIKAAIELGYRLGQEKDRPGIFMSKPEDVHEYLAHKLIGKTQEELWVLALNTRNRLIDEQQLYIGTVNHSSVRLAEIFEFPLRKRASAIILVHNHPSGEPQPSEEDLRFTEELVKAGRLLDIAVLDHIVIARGGYSSIRRSGKVAFNSVQPRTWH
jgi:DNA repair protein RadC